MVKKHRTVELEEAKREDLSVNILDIHLRKTIISLATCSWIFVLIYVHIVGI